MTKQEIKQQIKNIQSDIYNNSYAYDEKTIKGLKRQARKLNQKLKEMTPELVPGTTVSLEDFIIQIKPYTGKNDKPREQFTKDNYWRYRDDNQAKYLDEMLQYVEGSLSVYDYFLKNYDPVDITRTTIKEEREEVKSSNIYDRMCANTMTTYRTEFKITVKWNQEPVTVFREFTKNTTLSMSEVRAFM